MLLSTLGSILLGSLLSSRGVGWAGDVLSWTKFLMPPHPLTNIQIQRYYQKKSKFKGAYSRNNQSNTMKNGAENLDEVNLDE